MPRANSARRTSFYVVAVAIPIAFLGLLELALRFSGQHEEFPLFIPSPAQAGYLQANPEVVRRFFPLPDTAPAVGIETAYFRAKKPPGTLRIFVQGGSTAAGFPYGYGASLAGMLGQRLRRIMPGTRVEVVSTAMSAVSSYALLDFADEILDQRPDAILIYAGHNEYLGILGVGSVLSSGLSPGLTRATLRLRRYAVYQALERRLAPALRSGEALKRGAGQISQTGQTGQTLMARIAREKSIPYGSAVYERGLEQYRGNLERLLAKYRRAGVPVIIGLLASNERDLPPFAGDTTAGNHAMRFGRLLASAALALDSGALDDAAESLDAALALDADAADAWYARAQLLLRRGELSSARESFVGARDRDRLRFRAPEDLNEIVRVVARRHGATVADAQAALARASQDGSIGNEVMLEHVHPNLDGYFLLADAYFDALFAAGVLQKHNPLPSDAEARSEIPVSEVERLFGEYKLQGVINQWPFVETRREPVIPEPTNEIEKLAYELYRLRLSWPQAMGRLIGHYRSQGDLREETRVSLILADALPFVPQAQLAAGTALIRSGRAREAPRYLERAVRITPDDANALLAMSHALLQNGENEKAEEILSRVLALDPNNKTARKALEQLKSRLEGSSH